MNHIVADGPAGSRSGAPIIIGLVNSMPGEARRHTEQQFRAILSAAVRDVPMELRFFSLDAAPGGGAPDPTTPRYDDTTALEAAAPDGLIVTGIPPRAAVLAEEPYWCKLTKLVDFAVDFAVPTVWSCLAAHAAVFYLDGIERRRLPQKLLGLVDCTRTEAEHPAMDGLPRQWQVPHSRYNDLPEDRLRANGYRILSHSAEAGADIFAKDDGASFLFCQGHPEYDAQTLLREYRRDIRQFLAGEHDEFPQAPRGCFGPEVTARLAEFERQAARDRRIDTLEKFPMAACAVELSHAWRDLAVGLYGNWLAQAAGRKARRSESGGLASLAETNAASAFSALTA